ncbi:sulfite oxidase [Microvirga roseola]|uniref:sulfite oxidase n=1 Tax=Microvirga roseola TaxID=2883126 RepID=UPI001E3C6ED1|nr:sulfite oxidase [Microvirga roseola]
MTAGRRERGLFEFYEDDPERADYLIFGRRAGLGRRGFLKGAGLAAVGASLGSAIPFSTSMPPGLVPVALAQSAGDDPLQGKEGLIVHNDRPINAETPVHLLDPDITPNNRHFVRNNGLVPEAARQGDAQGWKLAVDGEVNQPLELTLDELRSRFTPVNLKLQLECGGNGRAGFNPPARGNQWALGAVGNSEWTGVRLGDVLRAAGLKDSAVYTAHYGSDVHLSGDPDKPVISRGVPIWKAMDPHTIIAFAMNGEPIPALNGFPVRLVVPGWPGSASQKWLTRITIRDQVHDGPGMTGMSYRVPAYPVQPGADVPLEDFRIIQAMPVKSIITYPATGTTLPRDNRMIEVRGHAWAGDRRVSQVDVSTDYGSTWIPAELDPPPNPYSWQRWRARLNFPTRGYYEVWARATDDQGVMQPFEVMWNPRGYLNNSMHRIALTVPT